MSASRIRYHILIEGRVQGVFFRFHTKKKAGELSLDGWVRNLPDSRVEVEVEGGRESIEGMLQWLQHGPSGAMVSAISSDKIAVENQPGFTIRL